MRERNLDTCSIGSIALAASNVFQRLLIRHSFDRAPPRQLQYMLFGSSMVSEILEVGG
jgi:hypothetical protein